MGFKKCLFVVAIVLAMINPQLSAMEVEYVQDPRIAAIYDTYRKHFYPCVILIHFNTDFQLPDQVCKNIAEYITSSLSENIFHRLQLYFDNATNLPILNLPLWDRNDGVTITKKMLQQVAETLSPENPKSKEAYALAESTIRNHYFSHYFFRVVEDLIQVFSFDVSMQAIINCLSKANIELKDVSFSAKYLRRQTCATQKDFLHAEIIVCLKDKYNIFGNYYLPTEKKVNYTIIHATLSKNIKSGDHTITIVTSVSKNKPEPLKKLGILDF